MRPESDLVTGDAVVLDLTLARSATRALGLAIDALVQVLALLVVAVLFVVVGDLDGVLLGALIGAATLLVLVGYPTTFETLSRGRTLGKLALGLRVVRDDGGPIRFRHAFTRALTGAFVDFGPFWLWSVVGFLVSLSSRKGKRVGDFLAGTVVLRDRAPAESTPLIGMPPALAHWASRLDLSALPDDAALSARQYLARYGSLTEEARERLGRRIADEIAGYLGAPVPPQVPPWAYLSAVLVERRNRDHARVAGVPPYPPQPGSPAPGPAPPWTPEPADQERPRGGEDTGPFAPPG
ncbi:putative RDD family membrane protein YckC [Prauserella shujinwangii]|uniref:Putative RDD family membrane protein YckC n=1 Tax=Prauserella shujinwangii TaxID=1453103 RepID=A0A2T0LM71_9PSEU|nr:RDD family protein [Prauserella shujinwangii]PRX44177.1 putative RDD family membrane protein YckC [Prauserella shujinwangii]